MDTNLYFKSREKDFIGSSNISSKINRNSRSILSKCSTFYDKIAKFIKTIYNFENSKQA